MYVLDMLSEVDMLGCRATDALLEVNAKLLPDQEILDDPKRYRRLVGKLNYLIITRLDIAFVVSIVSQFLPAPRIIHWDTVVQILRYLKKLLAKCFYIRIVEKPKLVSQMLIGHGLSGKAIYYRLLFI